MRLEAHHIPDSPDPDPAAESAATGFASPSDAGPADTAPGAAPRHAASPTRDHSTTRPRDHASPPEHSTSRALDHFPSPLTPAETHALETYLFTHNRNLPGAAAALGCPAVTLSLFLRQPHLAPLVAELTAAEERRELLPIIDQLKSDIFTSDNPAERRRTAAVVINFYTKGRATGSAGSAAIPVSTAPTSSPPTNDPRPRGRGAPNGNEASAPNAPASTAEDTPPANSESLRATAPPGSAGAAVSTSSTSSRPTNTAASQTNPTATSDGAPNVPEGFAAPHQSAPCNATDNTAEPDPLRATAPLCFESAAVSTPPTSSRPTSEATTTTSDPRATGSDAEPVTTSSPSPTSSNPNTTDSDTTDEHLRDSFASIAQQDQPIEAPSDPPTEPEEPAAQNTQEKPAAPPAPQHLTRADYGHPDIEAMPADVRRVAEETGIYKSPRPPPRQISHRYIRGD